MKEPVRAPVKKGQKVGEVGYYLEEQKIGSVDIVAEETVEKMNYQSAVSDTLEEFLL